MENTNENTVLDFIAKNPKANQSNIVAGTGLDKAAATEAIKKLIEGKKITYKVANKSKRFSLAVAGDDDSNDNNSGTTSSTETAKPAKKAVAKKTVLSKGKAAKKSMKTAPKAVKVKAAKATKPAKKANERTADNFNRDFGRLRFDGKDLPKGRLVHAVIAKHIEKNPRITSTQLKAAFPDELLNNWGIVKDAAAAKRACTGGKKRYFIDKEDLFTLKDGKTVAIANQFSTENIKPFLKHAKGLGYTITPSKAK